MPRFIHVIDPWDAMTPHTGLFLERYDDRTSSIHIVIRLRRRWWRLTINLHRTVNHFADTPLLDYASGKEPANG